MELQTVLTILVRRLWLVALCAAVATGAAFLVNGMLEPEYEAITMLAVNQLSSNGSLTSYDDLLANELLAKAYAETISSRSVLAEVITTLKLPTSPGELNSRITVVLVPQTQLLHLIVVDSDPQRAANTANTVVTVFREHNRSLITQRYTLARQSLEDELAVARADLDVWTNTVALLRERPGDASNEELYDAELTLNRYRNTYATISDALAKVQIAETQITDNIDVIEVAYPGSDPVWPNPVLNIAVAAVAGTLIGGFIALVTYRPAASPANKVPSEV